MFRNRKYYGFEFSEFTRRLRRYFEGNLNYRKLILILFVAAILFVYIGPYIFSWLFTSSSKSKGPISRCLDDRLTPFYNKAAEFNALIKHFGDSGENDPLSEHFDRLSQRFVPYAGNGYFGLEIAHDAMFHVKYGRHLSQAIPYKPIVEFEYNDGSGMELNGKQATVVDFVNGIVHKYQCFGSDFFITNDFYAHRVLPQVFIQEVRFTNTRNTLFNIDIRANKDNTLSSSRNIKLKHSSNKLMEFTVLSETIKMPKLDQKIIVTIVSQHLPSKIALKKRGITKLDIIHVIKYGITSSDSQYKQKPDAIESAAIEIMTNVLQQNQYDLAEHNEPTANGDSTANKMQTFNSFRKQHIEVWNNLWDTGFHISTSLAENVINGDQINATIYAVLSHARSYEFETNSSDQFKNDILKSLSYAEGCFDSYHTLQAGNLWKDMNNIQELNKLVQSWLLTLEKQGCHNLIKSGASGVLQAMVLSFGGFRFSNQHLEMNIHPKYLHRDYFFRRLNYGNMTHINISISVNENDNRAVMHVALDRSDGKYYACDAGCLDEPVALSQESKMFPVKLTEPLTAILYITLDKEHIEELRHAIHVKEVVEAPAHEHHVIALHKHGHQLGGLPTFFWVSIVALILIFHVFLCKLIIKEYCEPPEKLRYRYDKP